MKRLKLILLVLISLVSGILGDNIIKNGITRRIIDEKNENLINANKFLNLLTRNNITNCPQGFNFWSSDSRLECFYASQSDGKKLKLIRAIYPVEARGVRACSFIFNESDKCLFWSLDDSFLLYNGGFLDISGDGYIEKVITYCENEIGNSQSNFDRMKIFSFKSEKPELLLDVKFNIFHFLRKEDFLRIDISYSGKGKPASINLVRDHENKDNIYFKWSPEKQTFLIEGEKSKDWELVYCYNKNESKLFCPFHPEIDITSSKKCPICGYPENN